MAAQFCMKCGNPLPAGAAFCQKCGAPVPGAGPAPAGAAQTPPPPPPPGPGLAETLGVLGGQSFLVQHQFLNGGHSYRVLSQEKRHLFTARENFGQEYQSGFLGAVLGGQRSGQGIGSGWGARTFAWNLLDAGNAPRGSIVLRLAEYQAQSTVSDAAGTPVLSVTINIGLLNKLNATAVTPDGRPVLHVERNLIHHNFSALDAQGREAVKISEAFASFRDTYRVDLVAPVDPVTALLFAILIDREKLRNAK